MSEKKKVKKGEMVLKTISTYPEVWEMLREASRVTGINISRLSTAALARFCSMSPSDISAAVAKK